MAPPEARPLLPKEKIDSSYKAMRWRVFIGVFIGYAAFYLVRKNASFAIPGMIKDGILADTSQAGLAMAGIPVAYAMSKFLMGSVSDRSDARKFLTLGLLLTSAVMILTGLLPFGLWAPSFNVVMLFVLMFLAGWFSGMGWPPCGRVMVHWFSQNERSFKISVWNTAHNVGAGTLGLLVTAGMAIAAWLLGGTPDADGYVSGTWNAAFIFPSLVAVLIAAFCWWAVRDTPESCGLPSVSDWRNDHSGIKSRIAQEENIPFKTLFVECIFKNKLLWLIGTGNAFVYLLRYGIGDWAPTYLTQSNLMSLGEANTAFAIYEYAAIPGTILCGLVSSKFFKGRCAPPNIIFMTLTMLGVLIYWKAPQIAVSFASDPASVAALTKTIIYIGLFCVGFFIYGPIAMVGVQALNLVPKGAAGTAAGFMSVFGYLIGDAVLSKIVLSNIKDASGWSATFAFCMVAGLIAIAFLGSTWKREKALTEA